MRKRSLPGCLLVMLAFISQTTFAQLLRGVVRDRITQAAVRDARIDLPGQASAPVRSDSAGEFRLQTALSGKFTMRVSHSDFKTQTLEVAVSTGKEAVYIIELETLSAQLENVDVSAGPAAPAPGNPMSIVSTRPFTVEETRKYAAAANDPARMALAFPGVVSTSDGNNGISIRGNSPNGILWRMEGVEIPNPNHFAQANTSWGGISILSAQMLGNSDFSSGAFAAEYGNATSGVFDLKLRKGNNEKYEHTVQAGSIGVDLSSEGPFRRGHPGSYLVNYRYSTLGLLAKAGINLETEKTNFQDFAHNLVIPTRKAGTFGIFGFYGHSTQSAEAVKDSLKWRENLFFRFTEKFTGNTGALCLNNTKLFSNQSYLKTALVLSCHQTGFSREKLGDDYLTYRRENDEKYIQTKATLSSVFTKRISPAQTLRAGVIASSLAFNLNHRELESDSAGLAQKIKATGTTQLWQSFIQWRMQVGDKLTITPGAHFMMLMLNGDNSLEPRLAARYMLRPTMALTMAFGMHSQTQPLAVYFSGNGQTGTFGFINSHLRMSKAHHIVMGYSANLRRRSAIKAELYFQHLVRVPVSADTSDNFSLINNINSAYVDRKLENNGLGKNYGLEMSYECALDAGFYWLSSLSVFESKYRPSDSRWYNSRYNANYLFNLTTGRDWNLAAGGRNVLSANVKLLYMGGTRYTPLDVASTIKLGTPVYVESRAFSEKYPDYYRIDLRLSLTTNYSRVTTLLALDIQNLTDRKNISGSFVDVKTGQLFYLFQNPLLPIISYKVMF